MSKCYSIRQRIKSIVYRADRGRLSLDAMPKILYVRRTDCDPQACRSGDSEEVSEPACNQHEHMTAGVERATVMPIAAAQHSQRGLRRAPNNGSDASPTYFDNNKTNFSRPNPVF